MPQSDNHDYNVPNEGDPNWHQPLNDNFRSFDTDIEIRDTDGNTGNYTPKQGAKFLATDTGVVYEGDGSNWTETFAVPRYEAPSVATENAGNVVQGHPSNTVTGNYDGATISGGGLDGSGSSYPNEVTQMFGTVGGGTGNTADNLATVGGGNRNEATGKASTIAGGAFNVADATNASALGGRGNEALGEQSTIAGGDFNVAHGDKSTISGGGATSSTDQTTANVVYDDFGTIGGGGDNQAGSDDGDSTTAQYATVGGGRNNEASAYYATVGGGEMNWARGPYSTVPGGLQNIADGSFSFAAGRGADTNGHDAAVVFGDSSTTTITAQNDDEVRSQMPMYAPSFNTTSARAAKANVEPVDPRRALAGVESLEINSWEFTDTEDGRHIGPMAEDFHDAFDVGNDGDSIPTVDADGVAFAAIQGLSAELDEKDDRIDEQAEHIDDLEAENEALRDRLAAVEDHLGVETASGQLSAADD